MFKHKAVLALIGVLALGCSGIGCSQHTLILSRFLADAAHHRRHDRFRKEEDQLYARLRSDQRRPESRRQRSHQVECRISHLPCDRHGGAHPRRWTFQNQVAGESGDHTLICFPLQKGGEDPEGKLQATGELTLARVDRNVEVN